MRSASTVLLILVWPATIQAQLRIDRNPVDLGEVRAGQRLAHTFRFVNESAEVVELLEARPDCGCLTSRLEGSRLDSGAAGSVGVEVNTLGQASGPHSWRATLHFREKGVPRQAVLELRGHVISEVHVQPAALTLFTEGVLRHEITLTDRRPTPLRLTAVETTTPGIQARLSGPQRNAEGQSVWRILVEASANLPAGRHEDTLSIYSDDAAYRHLQVPVRVIKQPRSVLSVGPRELVFTKPPGGRPAAQLLRVWSGTDAGVDVVRVYADHPALLCTWAAGPGNQATVKVQIDPNQPGPAQPLHSAVHIEVRAPATETLTIPVTVE